MCITQQLHNSTALCIGWFFTLFQRNVQNCMSVDTHRHTQSLVPWFGKFIHKILIILTLRRMGTATANQVYCSTSASCGWMWAKPTRGRPFLDVQVHFLSADSLHRAFVSTLWLFRVSHVWHFFVSKIIADVHTNAASGCFNSEESNAGLQILTH